VVTASVVSALVSYLVVRLTITNQTDLSALRLAAAIGIFAGAFSLLYLGLAKALRISEVSAVLALVRRK
jgi:hypothetical protein